MTERKLVPPKSYTYEDLPIGTQVFLAHGKWSQEWPEYAGRWTTVRSSPFRDDVKVWVSARRTPSAPAMDFFLEEKYYPGLIINPYGPCFDCGEEIFDIDYLCKKCRVK